MSGGKPYHDGVSATRSQSKRDIAAELWRAVLALSMSQRPRFFHALQAFNLTAGDFRALTALDPDVPRPMRALAQAWECDASNATWIVDRLEERGFVERRAVPGDRRVKAIVLTPLGMKTKGELFAPRGRPRSRPEHPSGDPRCAGQASSLAVGGRLPTLPHRIARSLSPATFHESFGCFTALCAVKRPFVSGWAILGEFLRILTARVSGVAVEPLIVIAVATLASQDVLLA